MQAASTYRAMLEVMLRKIYVLGSRIKKNTVMLYLVLIKVMISYSIVTNKLYTLFSILFVLLVGT